MNNKIIIILILNIFFLSALFAAKNENCYLDEYITVAVKCSNTWHIGKQVDSILKPIIDYEPMTLLDLAGIHFPNGRISANWYDGQINIYALRIELDNVNLIENNAFNTEAFRTVDSLVLEFKTFTQIEADAFNNLPFLELLAAYPSNSGTHLWTSNGNILAPLRKTLQFFYDTNFIGKYSEFFGDVKLSQLLVITVQNPQDSNVRRVLASEDFCSLPKIRRLGLNSSGIESIAEHTFDYVGLTLIELHLSDNYITILSSDLLWRFISWYLWGAKLLHLSNNPLECNCEFYELKNITIISFGDFQGQSTYFTCIEKSMNFMEQCRGYQTIHTDKFFLALSNVYTFPKIEFKYNQANAEITIKNYAQRPYQLWFHNLYDPQTKRKHRCPSKGWLHQSIHCLILSNGTEVIDTRNYIGHSELSIVCALYLYSFNPILPLHCISVARHLRVSDAYANWTFLLMVVCAFGLVVGCCASFMREKYMTIGSTVECRDFAEDYVYDSPAMESCEINNTDCDNTGLENIYVIILP